MTKKTENDYYYLGLFLSGKKVAFGCVSFRWENRKDVSCKKFDREEIWELFQICAKEY